ncbi:glutathione S-transferase family protein [Vibrio astriarenae]|uniref:Glutathione S-transferase family protein n=1 Tax=Vibrio astriarenae TaxID=1481923 RepID=A0A7Z2T353_9VIBR|nr:glutathione S-transferase family protein [Vibrio astriarenae]QIA63501.1 glutathione S-transferase family protein [Vibrio astriarenae]
MLKFYFHPTPNPMKVALFLQEADLDFELVPVDTMKGEQHTEAYRAINPNGKTPAIVDGDTRIFDSNAILLYLSEKTGKFAGKPEDRGELLSWLMFIASGLGPFSGQSVHFRFVAPEGSEYGKNRYTREAERHYEVLDKHLDGRDYIVGDEYTIADIAAWGWIDKAERVLGEGSLEAHPNLLRWFNRINVRPAVERARATGKDVAFKSDFDEEAKRAFFPSNYPKQ